jgi:hypothetical protein
MNLRFWLVRFNWPGLVTGVSMLALPFLGFWWVAKAGEGAAELAFSPFDLRVVIAGKVLHSTLIELFLLAAKIAFILGGIFMILSSAFPHRWWSRYLQRFGVMRPFWSVIKLVVMAVVGTFFLTTILPLLIPHFIGEAGDQVRMEMDIPYLSGSGQATITSELSEISAPINLALTETFWLAVVTAGLGITARVYQRKIGLPTRRT